MAFSDEVLVRKTLEGDDSAFSELIKRHSGVVHGLCHHLVGNFTDAEDLVQEAFIKGYFKLSSLSHPERFLSWLRRITINVCRDWLRRQRHDTLPLEEISNGRATVSQSPAEICEAKELAHEEVLSLEMEIGSKFSQACALKQVAWHHECAGNKEKALEYYYQALEIFTQLGNKEWQAMIYYHLGDCLPEGNVEQRKEKISHYQSAFVLFAEAGVKDWRKTMSHAAINYHKHLIDEAIVGLGAVFWGYVCETFSKSSGAVFYLGSAGTQMSGTRSGSYSDEDGRKYAWTNVEEVKKTFNASPFRFLPEKTKLVPDSTSVGDSCILSVPSRHHDDSSPMKITVTIESNCETVSVPAGEFSNCLKVKIVTSEEPGDAEASLCGVRELMYAQGIGLVKSTLVRRDGTIGIAQLKDYNLSDDSELDYFPLAIGNQWFYEWADKDDFFPTTDVYEVVETDNNHYYVSHYYYALKHANTKLVID